LRKFDAEDAEPPVNGADHKNGSAFGSECNSSRKKRTMKTRPPASAGSRKRKGSASHESRGSDHPHSSRKARRYNSRMMTKTGLRLMLPLYNWQRNDGG